MSARCIPHCICVSRLVRSLLFSAILILFAAVAWGQTTGSIVGKATDPTGALVPDVTVKATNQATGRVEIRLLRTCGDKCRTAHANSGVQASNLAQEYVRRDVGGLHAGPEGVGADYKPE
jgi:hypothetical protein